MDVPLKDQKILLIRSGNRCAFPGCCKALVEYGPLQRQVIIGEIAHIVSESPQGPRGTEFPSNGEHNRHANLIFFCPEHHKTIDDQPQVFTAERLRQIKADHEAAIERSIVHSYAAETKTEVVLGQVHEQVHSTLLPVLRMPRYVWSAPCAPDNSDERLVAKQLVFSPGTTDLLCPFIIREKHLYAFNDLKDAHGPFQKVVSAGEARSVSAETWLSDPDRSRWFVTLLNRSLNKLTGRKGLRLDKAHRRYYFRAAEVGTEVEVKYRPLNLSALVARKVVWQPRVRRTGEPRPRWNHLAVNLSFLRVGHAEWCLNIRPEMRVTRDGDIPIESDAVGAHVTRRKSKMFNYDLLEEVNFWRDYLSDGRPRINLEFGGNQRIVISTTLMASDILWPGMPEEFAKPFRNVDYEEDLFSLAELAHLELDDDDVSETEKEQDVESSA
jgi:hypothetical protein